MTTSACQDCAILALLSSSFVSFSFMYLNSVELTNRQQHILLGPGEEESGNFSSLHVLLYSLSVLP